jgi:hypothetical protein
MTYRCTLVVTEAVVRVEHPLDGTSCAHRKISLDRFRQGGARATPAS